MADTVKKSRIVSGESECLPAFADEDTSLQDIINQEFNQRLKSCMREDNINESLIEPNAEHIDLAYAPNEQKSVLKNGSSDLKKSPQCTPQLSLDLKSKTTDLCKEESNSVLTEMHTGGSQDSKEETDGKNETIKNGVSQNGKTDNEEEIPLHSEITSPHLKDHSNGIDRLQNSNLDLKHSQNDTQTFEKIKKVDSPEENSENQQISPEKLEEPILCEVSSNPDISPEDSFVNKEIPSPEDVMESPFDHVTVTDVDNENLTAKERFLSTVKDLDDDDDKKTVKDRMFLGTETACLLFTQTVVQSPMLTPTEESYDFLQGLRQNSSDTNQTPDQISPIKSEEIVPILEDLTSKTTENSCQNNQLQHPEPDVDEISEISAENEVSNQLESSNSEQDISECLKSEEIPENQENIKHLTLQFIQNEVSEIDGDLLTLKTNTVETITTPTIVEHLVEDIDPNDGDFVENYAAITPDTKIDYDSTEKVDQTEDLVENIVTDTIIENDLIEKNLIEKEVLQEIEDFVEPDPKVENNLTEKSEAEEIEILDSSESKTKISPTKVSEISKIFTSKDLIDKEEIKSPVLEETFEDIKKTKEIFERKSDETILKSCDLVRKFAEPTSPGSKPAECDITNNECANISTTMTSESSFVETRTETNSSADKVLKKKKSKKSKKDNEKENISVCDYTNTNDDDNLSHVSVKNLCRSFSDLTSIGNKNGSSLRQKIVYGRTKSLSDIRRDDTNLEKVFSHVSVKSLRECFDNLTNRTNHCFARKASINNEIRPIIKTSDRIEKLKSSFSKFDALQKKTVLHVRSSDAGKAQEKFNGTTQIDPSSCKSCGKQVFQMEQMKAEKAIWHKNCFRCQECNKQLNVDTYQSNEGVLYCKPHFKALFTPKAVEDEPQPIRPRKHELIIRENQPLELPPDVVRASDKPDLGLEELQNLNVKERFQVFEHHENQENNIEKSSSTVNVKRSPSILSKLAKFQSKGMDIGVADDSLNGVPVEESSSEEEEEEEEIEGEDAELFRARRAQREKPMHFTNMSDVMSKWESGHQMTKEERREERKQEIQSIRSRLFMGKQAKIKEMYQQAVADSSTHVRKQVPLDAELGESARSLRERYERGEQLTSAEQHTLNEIEDADVFESGISKKSRSIFLELDANASKPPSLQQPATTPKGDVRRAREAYMARQTSEDVIRSSDQVDDVEVKTADISSRFKFFETYKEPAKQRKEFRITPPRDGQEKLPEAPAHEQSPPVSLESDTLPATESHTATRMLSVFRQLEESAGREPVHAGPKPLKRFTPPPEPQRPESGSEDEYTEDEDEDEVEPTEERRVVDEDLIEAQKAARAKQLRAKFEKWEANEIKREQNNSSVNIAEEMADADSQIESAKSLRARFESMREVSSDKERTPRVKVNRFV